MKTSPFPPDPTLTAGKHISFWTHTSPQNDLNPLKENIETDVVIVGGGLAGVCVAYCLLQTGKRIVLVDDGIIGSGETGRTTAHLVTALDDRYYDLVKMFGEDKTKLIAESHITAIDFVEETIKKENIDCDFQRVNGYLFLHPSDKPESLDKEFEAAIKAGVQVDKVTSVPGLLINSPGLCFRNQAQFHPLKFLHGLCDIIKNKGGKIYTGTHAEIINHEGITSSDKFTVKAKHIVVATNSPVNNLFVTIEKQVAYRTYVIGALVRKGILQNTLWWDTGDFEVNKNIPPYHYIRTAPYDEMYDVLISGGEDHPVGDTSNIEGEEKDRYKMLEEWTRNHFPIENTISKWSGQVMEPIDGIAYIGRNSYDHDNVYIVTGDSGNGMTHCSFAGLLISDLIHGKRNKWEELYSPSRVTLSKAGGVIRQILHDTKSFLKQMPNFNGIEKLNEVNMGEGKIVEMLEEQFGVYKDMNGELHIVSAKCTHLKCTVAWNADELSWDCPCHGSRFTHDGKVINGPANFDLPLYSISDDHLVKK